VPKTDLINNKREKKKEGFLALKLPHKHNFAGGGRKKGRRKKEENQVQGAPAS